MNTLPPGLRGYVAGQQANQAQQLGELQALQGILGVQNTAMEQQLMPLKIQQLQLAVDRAKRNNDLFGQVSGVLGGAPAPTGALAAGAAQGDIGPTVTNQARMGQAQPGGLLNAHPLVQAMLLSGDPGMEKYAQAYVEQNKPIAAREGAPVINPATGQVVFFAPKLEAGMVPNYANGQLTGVSNAPGYIPSMTERATAQERVRAGYDLVTRPPTSPTSPPTYASRLDLLPGQEQPSPATPQGWEQALAKPSVFDDIFARAAQQNGVDPADLKRLAITESSLNPRAVNNADGNGGSFGIMQINGQHLTKFGVPREAAMDPQTNIFLGAQLWKQALDAAGGDKTKAVQLYKGAVSPQGQQKVAGAANFVAAGMSPAQEADVEGRKKFTVTTQEGFAKVYNDLNKASMSNPGKIAKFERIGQLLGDFEGGKLSKAGFDLAQLGNSVGLTLDKNLPNKEAAEALSKEIALDLRSTAEGGGMPGAMSDADREFLRSMTPQMASTAEGRRQIIDSRVAVMKREMQVAEMARKFTKKYGQLNEDFFSQLSTWSNANPVFKK